MIQAKEIRIVAIKDLRPNPRNRNAHPDDQIERLAKIIQYQGFRDPLIVSNQSGLMVGGHGRLLAAKKAGLKELPVSYQDFADEAQEFAAGVSLNAIASWAELDLSGINTDVGEHGPELDIDLLGIKQFSVVPEFEPGSEDDQGQLDEKKPVQCPNCGEQFVPKG